MSEREILDCDLVVLGGGMAGMTAAAIAAEAGARVVVVEKSEEIGGSAALSGGYVWTATSLEQMNRHDDGDPALHAVIAAEYPHLMEFIRSRGVDVAPPVPVLYGRGAQIDMWGYLRGCAASVEKAGGFVVRGTDTREILMEEGRVAGVVTTHPDGDAELRAPRVLVATGGWQNDPDLRALHIHPAARDMGLRTNRTSAGDGLRLVTAAGGAWAGPNTGYYGHLIAKGAPMRNDSDYVGYTQYHSIYGVLLNKAGARFCDESDDDHASSQLTVRQPGATALLVWDDRVQTDYATSAPVAGAAPINKFELAMAAGAPGGEFDRIEDVAAFADSLGFDGAACVATVNAFNAAMKRAPEALVPLREQHFRAIDRAPWYVLQVTSAITFSFGGLFTDAQARALDPHGAPIEGLFVAGADVGNAYRRGYAGGLALAGTFAVRAMRTTGYLA